MNKVGAFIKKYWIIFCISSGPVLLYVYAMENKLVNPYLFPSVDAIKQASILSRGMIAGNMLVSFKLPIPSVTVSLFIALFLGAIMEVSIGVREVLHPVIYALSVIPSILLSPLVLLMVPSLFSASVFPIVYNITWATLLTVITGIMIIDKRYLDKAATLELRGFKRLIRVILLAASSSILAEFVDSLHSSFVMLAFAEMYGAGQGMGYFMKKYAELGILTSTQVGSVLMVTMLVIAVQISELLKKHLLKWAIDQRNSAEDQWQLGRRLEKTKLV